MNVMWLAVLAAAEGEGAGMGPFQVEFGLIFWTWLVFFALMYLLKRFAWPALVQSTEEREKRIQAQLAEAEKAHAEATRRPRGSQAPGGRSTRLGAAAPDRRASGGGEGARRIARARPGRNRRRCWSGLAGRSSSEKDKALAALRREAVELSLAAAGKLIGERMDSDTDRRLVTEYLDSVEIKH